MNYSKKKVRRVRNYRHNKNNLFNSALFIQTIKKKVFLSFFLEQPKTKGQLTTVLYIAYFNMNKSKSAKVQINT